MDEVQRLDRVALLDDAGDVDLARALGYHLDVHVPLGERREHEPGDTDHVAHLMPDQREDGHVAVYGHLYANSAYILRETRGDRETHGAVLLEVLDEAVEHLRREAVADRHADVHLARADEVDDDAKFVERAEDAREEAVAHALAVRVDVQHDDVLLDRDRRRQALALRILRRARECVQRRERHGLRDGVRERRRRRELVRLRVRVDHRPAPARVLDVLDADRDLAPDRLLHRERVHDLAAVVGQLRRLVGRDDGDEARSRDLARVGREDPVDLLPDLQLGRLEADREQRRAQVGVAAPDLAQERAWHRPEEAGDHRDARAALLETLAQGHCQRVVELLREGFLRSNFTVIRGHDVFE